MSNIHLTDELLMAFADGELDDSVATAVAQAIALDPSAGRQIADYIRSRQIVRSALSTPEQMMVSPALQAAVQQQIKSAEGDRGARQDNRLRTAQLSPVQRRISPWLPLAASVAAIAIGLGSFTAGRHANGTHESGSGILGNLSNPEVALLLDRLPSGKDEDLTFGRLRIIATYRTAEGVCREFSVRQASNKVDAIACRSGSQWNVVLAVNEQANVSYAPAGDNDFVDSYLRRVGAGEPLTSVAEQTLLAQ